MMAAATSGGGGPDPAIRCRHHQRANRLPHRSKRWQLTPLFLLMLFQSCGLVSAEEANTVRPLLLYIPMHVSEPLEHLQELCDRTLSKEPWVVGSGSKQKDEKDINLAFDILLVVSGPSDASQNATERFDAMRAMLESTTASVLPSPPRIFLDYKAVGVDKYNLNLAEKDKDAEWVSGPNSVFYDAFAEGGEIYEKYVRFYALVQQLETDVCALRGGWLSALLRPILLLDEGGGESESSLSPSLSSPSPSSSSPSHSSSSSSNVIIISGSTIKSSCSYVVKYDECQPFEPDASYMTEHVNGNAVYRMGKTLQLVLKSAREQFANAEPFDLAIHHVLRASKATSKLEHSNPLYHNAATLLDRDWFLDIRYHGVDDLAVLHAPRRLLADGLKTVATRAQGYLPATTVVLSEESMAEQRSREGNTSSTNHIMLLNNFKAAADDLRLSGVIYIALSEEVFFKASRFVPLQVLPAFERRSNDLLLLSSTGGGEVDYSPSSVASVSTTAAVAAAAAAKEEEAAASATADAAAIAAAAAAATAAASADPKSFVLTWPPTAPSPAIRLLATITQLVKQGYSPLVVDAASAPLQNYDMVLYGFRKDAIFFADTSPGVGDKVRRPYSSKTSDGITLTVETMYAPASAFTANFLQAWALQTLERQQGQKKNAAAAAAASAAAENTKLLSVADLKALAACRLETMSGFTPCPWRGVSVETLPVHWFAPQLAFFGSGWTKRARKHALFLDMSSGGGGDVDGSGGASGVASRSSSSSSSSKTIFRLRQAGNWHAPARCPTYSALSRLPRDLTHETVFDELALHAEFLSFVRERKIACAVLPGFRFPSTGATLPVEALLDLETIHASAGTQATILPRILDVEEASRGYVAFDQDRHLKNKQATSSSLQHSRKQMGLSEDDLCSAFHQIAPSSSTAACLAKEISFALNKARSSLPSSSFACALDARRTVEEVALTGLRGTKGLAEVAAKVSKATAALKSTSSSPPTPDAATILLTGAWRLLLRGSFGNVPSLSISLPSSSLAPSPPTIVTLSDLHSHEQELQCAQELNPKPSPLADEAWAGVLEALICRHSALSVDVSPQLSSSFSDLEKKNAPRSKAMGHRRKTTNKNFAELVARHIPPSILVEDVKAFAKWLARPDRPNLIRGRSLQILLAGEGGGGVDGGKKQLSSRKSSSISSISSATAATSTPPSSSSSRHKAALQSLSMLAATIAETRADYAFLPAAADATTGKLLPWSSVTDIGELYRVRPTLLPPSLAAMMHPKAVLEFLLSPESSTLPLNVAAEAGGAREKEGDDAYFDHRSHDIAFRKTVAALGRMHRRKYALLKTATRKLWVMPPAAAAGHQRSKETLPLLSMGATDDVVVPLSVGTG